VYTASPNEPYDIVCSWSYIGVGGETFLGSAPEADMGGCFAACQVERSCGVFSYVKAGDNKGLCYRYEPGPFGFADPNVDSGWAASGK
jgi:hypothetical protein